MTNWRRLVPLGRVEIRHKCQETSNLSAGNVSATIFCNNLFQNRIWKRFVTSLGMQNRAARRMVAAL
jgi:hypothetical protein